MKPLDLGCGLVADPLGLFAPKDNRDLFLPSPTFCLSGNLTGKVTAPFPVARNIPNHWWFETSGSTIVPPHFAQRPPTPHIWTRSTILLPRKLFQTLCIPQLKLPPPFAAPVDSDSFIHSSLSSAKKTKVNCLLSWGLSNHVFHRSPGARGLQP